MTAEQIFKQIYRLVLLFLAIVFFAQLLGSVVWRQYLDTPLLNYAGYLINEHNRVPYRDVFETSMPATLFFHCFLGRTVGFSDLAVRFADIVLLLTAMLLIFLIVKSFSSYQAVFAALLFALIYQSFGAKMALQRDFIGTVAILAAIYTALVNAALAEKTVIKMLLSGFFIGIGAGFKPHLAIVLPVIAFFSPVRPFKTNIFWKTLGIQIFGFTVSFSIPFFWIWKLGGLEHFWMMFSRYLPLHTQIGHDFTLNLWPGKLWYSISGLLLLNDHLILLLTSIIAIYLARFTRHNTLTISNKILFNFISVVTAIYFIYPAISGQFWFYHWSAFLVFAAISTSFLPEVLLKPWPKFLLTGMLFFLLGLQVPLADEFKLQLSGQAVPAPLNGVPDRISSFLKKNLQPGETVQPLDWVNGAIHGMLEAKALIATRFLYDYHFFHHLSSPLIQDLRREFIDSLTRKPPDYFIYVFLKSRVSGPDTSQDFSELGKFLFNNYDLIEKQDEFAIFKIKRKALTDGP